MKERGGEGNHKQEEWGKPMGNNKTSLQKQDQCSVCFFDISMKGRIEYGKKKT